MTVAVVSRFLFSRKLISGLLSSTEGIGSVLELENATESLPLLDKVRPHVLLISVFNPSQQLAEVRRLRGIFPEMHILLLVDEENEEFALRAVEAGAHGCISRKWDPKVLVKALNAVGKGEYWISRQVAGRIAGKIGEPVPVCAGSHDELTERECRVLSLLAAGSTNKEIASRLAISDNTVKAHLTVIYRKLSVTTRLEAVLHYLQQLQRGGAQVVGIGSEPRQASLPRKTAGRLFSAESSDVPPPEPEQGPTERKKSA